MAEHRRAGAFDGEIWHNYGEITYLGTEPSRRFPVYTRGNAGEVFPLPYHPLTFSTATKSAAAGMKATFVDSGVLAEDEFDTEFVTLGVFGGYSYLNLSLSRVTALRYPGGTAEQVDEQVLGRSSAPPHRASSEDKSLRSSLNALRNVWKTLKIESLPELEEDQRTVERWRATLPDPAASTDEQLLDTILSFEDLFAELWERHIMVSGLVPLALGGMTSLCEQQLGDPSLAMGFFAGIGDVESAEPAAIIWDLGRLVAADRDLTLAFDGGIDGLHARLRLDAASTDPGSGTDAESSEATSAASSFLTAFDAFLEQFGSRGPNEWDAAAETWGTNPDLALALIDRMRGADADHDPRRQQARLAADRDAAVTKARGDLNPVTRRIFDKLLTSGIALSQGRERAKSTIVRAIQESRIRIHELGRRCAQRAGSDDRDDIFYVIEDELRDYVEDPASFADIIAQRRAARDYVAVRIPPFIIDGEVPPIETWERRDADVEPVALGETLSGLGACPGVARGRARVILDPSDPGALGPGDVLVAPITDPAWTPLFVPAEAVVVDVGALISHAVIVSRELGIPAVVSATDATRRIPDGALIEVDGSSGLVTVLELPES